VHDLRDATSADAYCTLGGDIVHGKIAQRSGDKYALQHGLLPFARYLLWRLCTQLRRLLHPPEHTRAPYLAHATAYLGVTLER
jgi:hypothetical protein